MKILLGTLAGMLVILGLTAGIAQEQSGFINLQPEGLRWQPISEDDLGGSFATLYGNPAEEGMYVMRYRVPAGVLVPPHHHDQDRHITVMSGTWAFGTGDSHDCADTVPMTPGSYVFHPKGGVHFDGSCTDEPIEVQIIGMGPVNTVWADE